MVAGRLEFDRVFSDRHHRVESGDGLSFAHDQDAIRQAHHSRTLRLSVDDIAGHSGQTQYGKRRRNRNWRTGDDGWRWNKRWWLLNRGLEPKEIAARRAIDRFRFKADVQTIRKRFDFGLRGLLAR